MKFNYKSRKGFTLIELLVVIGILAVLAAIAIPSVAGLIDRANVSADNTNANEMTNAIERFASEYELYVQDIGSGALNPNDLDSAQGRVYNVTGATTRGDITAIEKAQSVKVADVGDEVAIYRDTKYPVNNATLQKIVENYMKTSSSTFEPKQSDCNYYYSPDCGIVVCTETDKASTTDLNALVVSGKDAKGKKLGSETQWINITEGTTQESVITAGIGFSDGNFFTWDELKEKGYDFWDSYAYPVPNLSGNSIKISTGGAQDNITTIICPNTCTIISDDAFVDFARLSTLSLSKNTEKIGTRAIGFCNSLSEITFRGTKSEWQNVQLDQDWNFNCGEITIKCSDGTITIPAY